MTKTPFDEAPAETKADLEERLRVLKWGRKLHQSRANLLPFVEFMMADPKSPNDAERTLYDAQPYHHALAKHLEQVERGELTQLIITLPPRAGKTHLAANSLIPWFMGRNPDLHTVFATYNQHYAEIKGGEIRNTIRNSRYKQVFPDLVLDTGSQSKARMETTKRGSITCVGRGGALTGFGSHLSIVDDILKDAEEARSQITRDECWNW